MKNGIWFLSMMLFSSLWVRGWGAGRECHCSQNKRYLNFTCLKHVNCVLNFWCVFHIRGENESMWPLLSGLFLLVMIEDFPSFSQNKVVLTHNSPGTGFNWRLKLQHCFIFVWCGLVSHCSLSNGLILLNNVAWSKQLLVYWTKQGGEINHLQPAYLCWC